MHIAIAGNIGAGKTTTYNDACQTIWLEGTVRTSGQQPLPCRLLRRYEPLGINLQIYFLNKRFRDVVEISRSSDTVIQDRTIFEDARIFAPNLHDMGLMSDRDFENYTHLFDLMRVW